MITALGMDKAENVERAMVCPCSPNVRELSAEQGLPRSGKIAVKDYIRRIRLARCELHENDTKFIGGTLGPGLIVKIPAIETGYSEVQAKTECTLEGKGGGKKSDAGDSRF
jgi:hypothetical protein